VRAGEREYGVRYVALDEVPDGSQDAITCHHVLEHIEEPASFLKKVHEKLAPGGVLTVHVPNCEPLTYLARNLLFRTRERGSDVYCQLYYPEHISGFDAKSLPAALKLHGFAPLRVRTAAMWSKFYDPFFLANYFRDDKGRVRAKLPGKSLARQVVQSVAENVGTLVERGDWVIGHFRAV
jgi:SAM-dependent methyltransferase